MPMKVRMIVVLVAAVLATSGCSFGRAQLNMKRFQQTLPTIEPGVTHISVVEQAVGPATSITPVGDYLVYSWVYSDSKTQGLTLILLNISKTNTGFDVAHVRVRAADFIIEGVKLGKNSTEVDWEWWAFGD